MGTVAPERAGAPTRGRRRAPSQPNRWRRPVGLLVGVAFAAAAVWAQTFAYTRDDRGGPLTWTGGVGDEVRASRVWVQARAVHAAKTIEAPGLGGKTAIAKTTGIFLVVDLAAQATREPQKIVSLEILTADGKRYTSTDRVPETQTIKQFFVQPGWWATGPAVFELPVSELAGARIVVSSVRGFIVEPSLPEVEIDLGLDEAGAARLVSEAKDIYSLGNKK
ncbi:hypothetical protein [Streptosporangium sp. NPDC020145]|uniref:DUF4352 domain-containing protein n=1 Tax=Streptosporangium jomthongense TaxID=1193683 RepID=A0ABV8ET99_9ACTN